MIVDWETSSLDSPRNLEKRVASALEENIPPSISTQIATGGDGVTVEFSHSDIDNECYVHLNPSPNSALYTVETGILDNRVIVYSREDTFQTVGKAVAHVLSFIGDIVVKSLDETSMRAFQRNLSSSYFVAETSDSEVSFTPFPSPEMDDSEFRRYQTPYPEFQGEINSSYGDYEFERLIAEIWSGLGYETEVTPKSNDKGVDVKVYSSDGFFGVLQAKRQRGIVSIDRVHRLSGVVSHFNADGGVLVTNSYFTEPAIDAAAEIGNIELVSGVELSELMEEQDESASGESGKIRTVDWYVQAATRSLSVNSGESSQPESEESVGQVGLDEY